MQFRTLNVTLGLLTHFTFPIVDFLYVSSNVVQPDYC